MGSCSKIKKTKKRIDGEWEIISYRTTNSSGLTHYYDAIGTITFGDDTENTFTYSENFSYEGSSGTVNFQRQGIGTFTNDEGLKHSLHLLTPVDITMDDCTFRLVTKDDLKIEQRDNYFTYTIVLKND